MATLSILGSTGSIGKSTLRVVNEHPARFTVTSMSCRSNLKLFEEQLKHHSPRFAAVSAPQDCDKEHLDRLKKTFPDTTFFFGEEGLSELAGIEADICVSAIVGAAGLRPTLKAVESCSRIALANKETLVMAGPAVLQKAAEYKTEIIPVDSEHSAVHSLLHACSREALHSVILTASGGSLRDIPVEKLPEATVKQALAHPTWDMGSKITIDSATLFNKGLEVIEAHYLFGFDYDAIKVLIHPESIIHSLIETVDGALFAHLGAADMAHPISNALFYPDRVENSFERLNLANTGSLTFRKLDNRRYPALQLCYQAGREGGTMPAVMNAANEAAVYAFLDRKIPFTGIYTIVESVMERHKKINSPTLDEIFESDIWARKAAAEHYTS